jgi:hypothetical protein
LVGACCGHSRNMAAQVTNDLKMLSSELSLEKGHFL